MPNHITNIVSIKPRYADEEQSDYERQHSLLCKLYKDLHTENSDFDFNAIIPEPKNIEQGGCSGKHKKGEVCWYKWNNENWGTKWNAYEVKYLNREYRDDEYVFDILVKFETAWRPPYPILQKLAENFEVEFTWMDEGNDEWHNWEKLGV